MTYYIKDFSLFLMRVRESFPFTNNKFSLILILYALSYNIYNRTYILIYTFKKKNDFYIYNIKN